MIPWQALGEIRDENTPTYHIDCIQISLRETITSLHARLKDQNYRLVLLAII